MYHVLFIDDDKNLLHINKTYFERHGYEVSIAATPDSALALVDSLALDCIVLDIILPNGPDGYQICDRIKKRSQAPIIFLTSLTEQEFLYRGFSAGGDDYMTKPYDLKELELRVAARINQHQNLSVRGEVLHFPPLSIDIAGRRVYIHETLVELTNNEFDILLFLARSPNQAHSPEEIYREVWKMPDLYSVHTVQVHVARMRHKLEAVYPDHKFIGTAWGRGYLFQT